MFNKTYVWVAIAFVIEKVHNFGHQMPAGHGNILKIPNPRQSAFLARSDEKERFESRSFPVPGYLLRH